MIGKIVAYIAFRFHLTLLYLCYSELKLKSYCECFCYRITSHVEELKICTWVREYLSSLMELNLLAMLNVQDLHTKSMVWNSLARNGISLLNFLAHLSIRFTSNFQWLQSIYYCSNRNRLWITSHCKYVARALRMNAVWNSIGFDMCYEMQNQFSH